MDNKLPNIVDPVTKSTEDVIVCTTKVWAVIVPLINAFEAVKFPPKEAVNAFNAQLAVPNKDPVIIGAFRDPVTVNPLVYLPEPDTSKLAHGLGWLIPILPLAVPVKGFDPIKLPL